MTIDPKKCGKCWSCKYCEDIGTHTYEDYVSYMRKCTKHGQDPVDKCVDYCKDYEWDQKTPIPQPAAPVPLRTAPVKKSNAGVIAGIVSAFIGIAIIIAVAVVLLGGQNEKSSSKDRDRDSNSSKTSSKYSQSVNGSNQPTVSDPASSAISSEVAAVPEADFDDSIYIVMTEDTTLRMRSEPVITESGAASNVIENIPRYAPVTLLEDQGDWLLVRYGSKVGYCSADFLMCINEFGISTVTYDGSAPLRKKAKATADIINTVPDGTLVPVIAVTKSGEWTRVYFDGETGWIASNHLE